MPKREHSNLFQRYIWLAETIVSASDGLTFDEIDRIWRHSVHNEDGSPLPKKTFQRHCREIEVLFGTSIVCNRHNGYRYHIDDNASPEMRTFFKSVYTRSIGLSLSKTLTKHSFSRKISTGRLISEIVTELNATRRSRRNISCFGPMETKPHISARSRFTRLKRRLPQPQSFPILNYMSDRPLTSVKNSSLTAETSRSLVRNLFGQSFMTRQGEWYEDMQESKNYLSRTVY